MAAIVLDFKDKDTLAFLPTVLGVMDSEDAGGRDRLNPMSL